MIDVREMLYGEHHMACDLVRENWGEPAAERALMQMGEYFRGGPYAPRFFVADRPNGGKALAGFAAYAPTMLMNGDYDLIWLTVTADLQWAGIGSALTRHRIAEVRRAGGSTIKLSTQKPKYFARFGFRVVHEWDSWHLMVLQLETVRI
jgi:GNAT superfamily N-acetyltransferase